MRVVLFLLELVIILRVKNTSYLHAKFRIGNAIDPLTSLCAKQVYSIPLLILIGWRGAPNIKDAPQHTMVGETILRQLKLFKIKNVTLKTDKDLKKISKLINFAKKIKLLLPAL